MSHSHSRGTAATLDALIRSAAEAKEDKPPVVHAPSHSQVTVKEDAMAASKRMARERERERERESSRNKAAAASAPSTHQISLREGRARSGSTASQSDWNSRVTPGRAKTRARSETPEPLGSRKGEEAKPPVVASAPVVRPPPTEREREMERAKARAATAKAPASTPSRQSQERERESAAVPVVADKREKEKEKEKEKEREEAEETPARSRKGLPLPSEPSPSPLLGSALFSVEPELDVFLRRPTVNPPPPASVPSDPSVFNDAVGFLNEFRKLPVHPPARRPPPRIPSTVFPPHVTSGSDSRLLSRSQLQRLLACQAESPTLPSNPALPVPAGRTLSSSMQAMMGEHSKLSRDVLLWTFYNCPGSPEQAAAAAALRQQGWRFHIRDRMWFWRSPNREKEVFYDGTRYVSFSNVRLNLAHIECDTQY
ncbi:hypothetical protein KIPB_004367 [Kipferlia bialata]|uniref:NOT2/NOT3/NOT5 C-terminal domain-containing protein n=1 Tax=Kipferlia bialata TaxID=797122 RepID=A0A9K3CVB4_9EUKA|nr:hypothetical protein KIPB_004367 [Kipferlia bialata]|eukprot:g4367.t1